MPKYLDGETWMKVGDCKRDAEATFEVKLPPSVHVLCLMITDQSDYEQSAFALFERGGEYFEVYGSHCSCYGFEGQWTPEESNFDALRKFEFWGYDTEAVKRLHRLLDRLEKPKKVRKSA